MAFQRTSAIPDVKAKLVNSSNTGLFQTTLATAGENPNNGGQIEVQYGDKTSYERESVVVGDTREQGDQEWSALGGANREETFSLAFVVICDRDTQQEATERAFAIFGLLETALRNNNDLDLHVDPGGFEHILVEIAQPQLVEEASSNSYLARVISAVRVTARI